jgi:hypothetical protein
MKAESGDESQESEAGWGVVLVILERIWEEEGNPASSERRIAKRSKGKGSGEEEEEDWKGRRPLDENGQTA